MKKIITISLILFAAAACSKNEVADAQEAKGEVWLSGGLAVCAEQIRLDNGQILVASVDDIKTFKSNDRVIVKYNQTSLNQNCSPALNCKIISIRKE